MATAHQDDDHDGDEVVTLSDDDKPGKDTPEDNGNTPDTPEEIASRAKPAKAAEADADDAEAEPGKKPPPNFVPRARLNEVSEQLAETKALLAAALNKPAAPAAPSPPAEPAFDVKAARKAYLAAVASGDDDKALELDEQIEAHRMRVAEENAVKRIRQENQEQSAQQVATELASAAKGIQKTYPQLDAKSADADPDAIDFVIFRRDKLIAAGTPAGEALRQAADLAAKAFGFAKGEKKDPAPTEDPDTARTIQARLRNADAANRQPPELGGRGDRGTQQQRVNVAEMTDEEFAALPAAEKKRLRGDA